MKTTIGLATRTPGSHHNSGGESSPQPARPRSTSAEIRAVFYQESRRGRPSFGGRRVGGL